MCGVLLKLSNSTFKNGKPVHSAGAVTAAGPFGLGAKAKGHLPLTGLSQGTSARSEPVLTSGRLRILRHGCPEVSLTLASQQRS